MSVKPELRPEPTSSAGSERYRTVIFNNDFNSMDEVVVTIMLATNCSMDEAYMEMWEAHHFGQADIHFAAQPECERVAAIVGSIGIKTEVHPEWKD